MSSVPIGDTVIGEIGSQITNGGEETSIEVCWCCFEEMTADGRCVYVFRYLSLCYCLGCGIESDGTSITSPACRWCF